MYLVGFKCNIKASIHILIGLEFEAFLLALLFLNSFHLYFLFLMMYILDVLVFIFYAHYTFLI